MTKRAGTGTPSPLITVSMPAHNSAGTLRRAVDSVLGQTFDRLRLVVVNDGDPEFPWHILDDIHDPRLIRFDLPANRGRYFADAVTLAATTTTWWTPHDADDWSEPNRLEALHRKARGADVVFGAYVRHIDGEPDEIRRPRLDEVDNTRLRHVAHHTGLYRAEALRSIGGPHPEFRVAYDTLMVDLCVRGLRCRQLDTPLYHWCSTPSSLSMSRETGMRSRARRTAWNNRRNLWQKTRRFPPEKWAQVLAPTGAARRQVRTHAARLQDLYT